MTNFIDANINQTVLLDINYLDQRGTNNFDFYLYSLLNKPHFLNDFLDGYRNKLSLPARVIVAYYLLRIIFCAYYRGITLSRVIASLCETDLTFMAFKN